MFRHCKDVAACKYYSVVIYLHAFVNDCFRLKITNRLILWSFVVFLCKYIYSAYIRTLAIIKLDKLHISEN